MRRGNRYLTNSAPPHSNYGGETTQQFKSADEQLTEAMNNLHTSLKYSTTMPDYAIRRWCDHLAKPQTQTLSGLKTIIKQIRADCEQVNLTQLHTRTPQNSRLFTEQMATIKNNLEWIIQIVDHIIAYIQKHRRPIESPVD